MNRLDKIPFLDLVTPHLELEKESDRRFSASNPDCRLYRWADGGEF